MVVRFWKPPWRKGGEGPPMWQGNRGGKRHRLGEGEKREDPGFFRGKGPISRGVRFGEREGWKTRD